MRSFFLLLVLVLAASPAWAKQPVIVVLGDSLSAGYGLEPGAGWVALLERRLSDKDYPHRIVNASISGDTTAGGLARLPRILEREKPEVLVIELGGNDGLRGIPPQETERNLARMIELGRQHGATVLLAAIRLPPNYGPAFADRFEAVFSELAQRYSVRLIPFISDEFEHRPELLQDDGLHPTAEAQPLLLNQVWPQLKPVLEATTS